MDRGTCYCSISAKAPRLLALEHTTAFLMSRCSLRWREGVSERLFADLQPAGGLQGVTSIAAQADPGRDGLQGLGSIVIGTYSEQRVFLPNHPLMPLYYWRWGKWSKTVVTLTLRRREINRG